MKKELILIFLLIFIVTGTSAREIEEINGQEIPSRLKSIVGNQNINIYLDNLFVFSLKIDNGKIVYLEEELEKSTLEIYSSKIVVDTILESEDPVSEILDYYNSGEIIIKRKTILNKIKFLFLRFFI